jgi:hypothetical protein
MPLRPGQQVQRHWRALESIGTDNGWSEVVDEFLRLEGEVDCRVSELERAALGPARVPGEVIDDPDVLASWTVTEPPPEH